jgi:C1A family cysteine protease
MASGHHHHHKHKAHLHHSGVHKRHLGPRLQPDPHHHKHKRYDANQYSPDELPGFVDLRPFLTEVEDQGQVGSCTANALVGAYEYLENRIAENPRDISRLFIYYNERVIENDVRDDNGAMLSDGVKALKKWGACHEDVWPYDETAFANEPAPDAYTEGAEHVVDEAFAVDVDLHAMRQCLAEGYPFVFGLLIDDFEPDEQGRISIPAADAETGGHAMCCVGYSDEDEVFLVRNSWGSDWGDGGYCYVPYAYMTDPDRIHDLWTIRRPHDLDLSQGIGEDEPPHGDKTSFFA